MPRAKVKTLAAVGVKHAGIEHWKCSSYGAVGEFASDLSAEWLRFANDFVSMHTQRISRRPGPF
jgi:hypothetical protein